MTEAFSRHPEFVEARRRYQQYINERITETHYPFLRGARVNTVQHDCIFLGQSEPIEASKVDERRLNFKDGIVVNALFEFASMGSAYRFMNDHRAILDTTIVSSPSSFMDCVRLSIRMEIHRSERD